MSLIPIFQSIENKLIRIYYKYNYIEYNYIMINICVYCNPNYGNKAVNTRDRLGTIKRNIDLVSQLIVLFKTMKKNWSTIDYDFYCFYNKNIKWSEYDLERVSRFEDLNLIGVDEPDRSNVPWQTRVPCFIHKLKREGSHRLVLDCDMVAYKPPIFNLECDWQATFSGGCVLDDNHLKHIINKLNYSKMIFEGDTKYIQHDLMKRYYDDKDCWQSLFPYFNAGAVLIKESLTNRLVELWKPAYDLTLHEHWPGHCNNPSRTHFGIEFALSFSLFTLSSNWEPLEPGINYLLKGYDVNKFGKENLSLVHYCGINAEDIAKRVFPEYFNSEYYK